MHERRLLLFVAQLQDFGNIFEQQRGNIDIAVLRGDDQSRCAVIGSEARYWDRFWSEALGSTAFGFDASIVALHV